jgi:hypothetical protein
MSIDWQTVVVSVVALGAAGVVLRRFLPARRKAGAPASAPACEHCEPVPEPVKRTQTTPVISVSDLRKSARR